MSRPKNEMLKLSTAEREVLESIVRRHNVGQQIALRARIILEVDAGKNNKEVAKRFGISLVQLGVDTTAVNQARYSCTAW